MILIETETAQCDNAQSKIREVKLREVGRRLGSKLDRSAAALKKYRLSGRSEISFSSDARFLGSESRFGFDNIFKDFEVNSCSPYTQSARECATRLALEWPLTLSPATSIRKNAASVQH